VVVKSELWRRFYEARLAFDFVAEMLDATRVLGELLRAH
jgi:hypothetical protein